jgi:hypothetical protein
MAKKKAGAVNKSQAIRDYRKAHPKHKPQQIAEELSKSGVKVSAQFVSTVLSNAKKKPVRKPGRPKSTSPSGRGRTAATRRGRPAATRRGRPAATRRGRPAGRSSGRSEAISVESLLRVKEVAEELGGIDDVRTALNALEQLTT